MPFSHLRGSANHAHYSLWHSCARRSAIFFTLALACAVPSDGGSARDPVTPLPTSQATTGQVVFWTDNAQLAPINVATSIAVSVSNGGTIANGLAAAPACGSGGAVTVTASAGTLSYSATGAGGVTWTGSVNVEAGKCISYRLYSSAPPPPPPGGNSLTGARSAVCSNSLGKFANTSWTTLPAPLSGLDVKLYFSETWNTADVVFRNRYQTTIHFGEVVSRSGITPPPATTYRHDLTAGREESPPGPNLGVNVGLGGKACVVVDKVRFGQDSGPYYNP